MELLLAAYITDLIIGDPRWIPHPVVIIGKFISYVESKLYSKNVSPRTMLFRGFLLVFLVLGFTLGAILGLLFLFRQIHP